MATPHNNAKKGEIAKTVLMPGDPLRAKFIAETFLKDVKQFNAVRNMFGYTGTYKGKKVSVMGSGMGMPSMGIYSYELFKFYGVEKIIRIGTCGSYTKKAPVYSIILAQGSCTNSNWSNQFNLGGTYSALADFELLEAAYQEAKKQKLTVNVGNVFASDVFYTVDKEEWKKWAKLGVLGVDMESYALYCNAALLGKKALTILTVSDSFVDSIVTTPLEREQKFTSMMKVALEII